MTNPAPPLADPGPPPPTPPGLPRGADRFFSWVEGLGLARADGWLGGVCAGVAARLRIDPLIVRGVVVVAALFGLPMLLVYAIAWALLPDVDGRVHARELFHGRFDPAIVGIGILLVLGFVPVVPWTLQIAAPGILLFDPFRGGITGFGLLVLLAVVGGLVFLIVRAARRGTPHEGVSAQERRKASAAPAASAAPGYAFAATDSGTVAEGARVPDASAVDAALVADAAAGASAPAALTPPAPEPVLATAATDEEIAAWRTQHAQWKAQDDAWRRQQQDAERFAREHARRERQTAAAAFAAEADERRRLRRASKPRTSVAFVATTVGLALVAGAGIALWQGTAAADLAIAVAIGLFAAVGVIGAGMVVAGIARRRSGFLAFVAIVLLVAASATAGGSVLRGIRIGDAYVSNVDGPQEIRQAFGHLSVELAAIDPARPLTISKDAGSTDIVLGSSVSAVLDLSLPGGDVPWTRIDERTGNVIDTGVWPVFTHDDGTRSARQTVSASADGATGPNQTLRVDQRSGTISVTIYVHDSGD